MNLKTLEEDLAGDAARLGHDLLADLQSEAAHIADPAECGNIVRRHFDGLTMTLLLFVAVFLGAAAMAIFLYARR